MSSWHGLVSGKGKSPASGDVSLHIQFHPIAIQFSRQYRLGQFLCVISMPPVAVMSREGGWNSKWSGHAFLSKMDLREGLRHACRVYLTKEETKEKTEEIARLSVCRPHPPPS